MAGPLEILDVHAEPRTIRLNVQVVGRQTGTRRTSFWNANSIRDIRKR